MSNSVFPPSGLDVCLAWNNRKVPAFSTISRRAAQSRESRLAQQSFPTWKFIWQYKVLSSATPLTDQLQGVVGFFLKHHGAYESFLITDTEDNHVDNELLGAVDANSQTFQLTRTYGGFKEPMFNPKGTPTIQVKIGGVWMTSPAPILPVTVSATGIVSFGGPLLVNGVSQVRASFDYYHRVHFLTDEMEVEQFMVDLFNLQTVEMMSDPP